MATSEKRKIWKLFQRPFSHSSVIFIGLNLTTLICNNTYVKVNVQNECVFGVRLYLKKKKIKKNICVLFISFFVKYTRKSWMLKFCYSLRKHTKISLKNDQFSIVIDRNDCSELFIVLQNKWYVFDHYFAFCKINNRINKSFISESQRSN